MTLKFEIIKLLDRYNRGQFIVARLLDFKEPVTIKEGALLNGIQIFHYLEMYPFGKEEEPRFDIYVLRPTRLEGYPKGTFWENQIVELIN